jgi:hypothetical protein
MKFEKLSVGKEYRSKVSGSWQVVTLTSKREEYNKGKLARDKEVLVRTGSGNTIYRSPGQLRLP